MSLEKVIVSMLTLLMTISSLKLMLSLGSLMLLPESAWMLVHDVIHQSARIRIDDVIHQSAWVRIEDVIHQSAWICIHDVIIKVIKVHNCALTSFVREGSQYIFVHP